MKYSSFDLEIAEELTPDKTNNLGISAAAILLDEQEEPFMYWDTPRLKQEHACSIVIDLMIYLQEGYLPLTWNGTTFDFRILAEESGMIDECAKLALTGIDMMLLVTFVKGYFLGLDKALIGAGLESKTHTVILKNGETLSEMNGAMAPALWRAGETEAVLTYLKGDVIQPLKLIHAIEREHFIKWTTNSGKPGSVFVPKILTVQELFALPEPDTSWMTKAPKRLDFVSWIPAKILDEFLPNREKTEGGW